MRKYLEKMKGRQSYYPGNKTTVILDSLSEAMALGTKYVEDIRADRRKRNPEDNAAWEIGWDMAIEELRSGGTPEARKKMMETASRLAATVLELTPSLATGYMGLERSEDGFTLIPALALAGEERFMLRRRVSDQTVKSGSGDGAYRIVINTDVPWWGSADTHAAVLGALVLILQNFGPVEIWVQQGWIGHRSQYEKDGVTLFKLDCSGQFEPAQISFWIGSQYKDTPFSYCISRALGRIGSGASNAPQIPTDLYLHGCWMSQYVKDTSEEGIMKQAVEWITSTVSNIVFVEGEEALNTQ